MPSITARAVPALLAALLLTPAAAEAAQRYTTPAATATAGTCAATKPCRVDHAINGAAAGDEVIVATGTYSVGAALAPQVPLDIHGAADQAPPVLISTDTINLALLSFKDGGTLRHLTLQATGTGQDALTLEGGLAEDVTLISGTGDGAKVVGGVPATVLRDAVVRTGGTGSAAGLKLREAGGAGDVALRNVTVMAPGSNAIRCEVRNGAATLVNVIARGAVSDVDASLAPGHCTASHSNLRAERSPALTLGPGIQAAEPRFVDAADGDYRPLPDSPTVDAGTADALLGAADPDGRPRKLGGAPDIGAFEYPGFASVASGEETDTPDDPEGAYAPPQEMPRDLRGVPVPIMGDTVVVAPGQGRVLVRRPGGRRFKRLGAASRLPVGSVVDATRGRIRLVSAVDTSGGVQTGGFWGGRFQIRQSAAGNGMTSLALRGGDFSACPATAVASRVAGERRRSRRVVRSLWARDRNGRFRTHGHNSVATARGTAWVTRDRCDGTVTRVKEGAVAVRDRAARRTVLVRAGHSYLARVRG